MVQADIIKLQNAVAINRDEAAYRQLFINFHQPLIKFGFSIIQSEEAAEDLYSEVMIKIWLMEESLAKVENLKQYLYTLIRNAAFNELKVQKKVTFSSLDDLPDNYISTSSVEDSFLKDEFVDKINDAIKSLPPKCGLVYRLIREDGFNYKQTSEILGISVNTIEGHMTSAIKKISESLRKYLH
ncbi:sigma-70 family RNA polymerase sigma factor [Mucilaginibacter sp. HC2]|uniref:RNA polymerase sigma factor n=1 Tax=Mucilaginibacter inviolabilis TaxID=2714892 RepID=UPI00140BF79D|nr:sigma-70 family RNA polymerase sigma factor [Mucilaginibacter inviolabilis]NHA03398.1 sigma-70 family RNA polymerase sigma factor [Mucilaginibacter inviolabilis]